jgi:hypothetical protein
LDRALGFGYGFFVPAQGKRDTTEGDMNMSVIRREFHTSLGEIIGERLGSLGVLIPPIYVIQHVSQREVGIGDAEASVEFDGLFEKFFGLLGLFASRKQKQFAAA